MKFSQDLLSNTKLIYIFKFISFIIIVILGGLYYFFLQSHFYPSTEEIAAILPIHYKSLISNYSINHLNNPFWWISSIIYHFFGLSVFSVRFFFTVMYCLIIGLGLIIIFRKQIKLLDLFVILPIFVFMSIILHPFGGDSKFGILSPMIYFLYYNTHQLPIIAAFLSIILLDLYVSFDAHKFKWSFGGILLIQSLYSLIKSDLCYAIIFVTPVCIIYFLRCWHNSAKRFRGVTILAFVVSVIVLTRRIPQLASSFFWGSESVTVYSGSFYGSATWLDVLDILNHISKYIKNLLLFSNSDFSNYPIVDGYSIIFAFRIALLVYGLILATVYVCKSLSNHLHNDCSCLIDVLISWSIIIQSLVYIFSTFADSDDQFRYIWSVIILIPILICRNIPKLLAYSSSKYNIAGIQISFTASFLICSMIISFAGSGTDIYEEPFEDELINVCHYISSRETPESNDNYISIAPYWFYGRLVIETGEVFFPKGSEIQNSEIKYVVTNVDTGSHIASALRIGLYDDAAIRKLYGQPIEIYEQEHINVYVYK